MTPAQKEALEWFIKHGGDGVFDKNGVLIVSGETAPHTRSTWNALRDSGHIEFYNPSGKGRGRVRLVK